MTTKYDLYGLPSNRENPIEGGDKGLKWCPWCQSAVRMGVSLCFQHFVICPDCARTGAGALDGASAHPLSFELSKKEGCWKCRKTEGWGYKDREVDPCFSLCEECLRLAVKVTTVQGATA